MISKNIFTAITLFLLHHGKQRRNIRILGGSLLAIGIIGMITTGSIVIQDTVNNNLTPKGYPKTEVLDYIRPHATRNDQCSAGRGHKGARDRVNLSAHRQRHVRAARVGLA